MPTGACTSSSRSLRYGLQLLRLFDAQHPVRGISELAELMHVSRPTAHRYASTCLELGYLEAAPLRRYRLAPRAAQIGQTLLASLPLSRLGGPIVRELRDVTGHTASLAVLAGEQVVYLHRLRGLARGQYELEHGIGAGSRLPAAKTAAGQALLAGEERPLLHEPATGETGGIAIAVQASGDPAGGHRAGGDPAGGDPAGGHHTSGDPAGGHRAGGHRTAALELALTREDVADLRLRARLSERLLHAAEQLRGALHEEDLQQSGRLA